MAKLLSLKAARPPAEGGARRPLLGELLVRAGHLAPAKLAQALSDQSGQDVPLGRILLASGTISHDTLADMLSMQAGVGRADLVAAPPEAAMLSAADPYLCLKLEAVPWRHIGGRRVIAVANPVQGDAAMEAFAVPGEGMAVAIAPADAIRRVVSERFGSTMVKDAEARCPPRLSCRTLLANGWSWRKVGFLAALAAALAAAPGVALQMVLAWVIVMTLATTALRVAAVVFRLRAGQPLAAEVPRFVDSGRLPPVSVLVPLKGEAAVAGQLMTALRRMEYPEPLLDIKLVLEAGDDRTLAAVHQAGLPPNVEVVIVPKGTIQTKPRALNYALPFCRGEIVGIYDAEDRPDPGQIRAVVHRLMDAPPEVACVQGTLDFYNTERNWLSRCFTIDYATWFRILLPGVERLGLPVPLGGTTVFFRRKVLEEIGGWDAHNVTEDADLGMRLTRFGYRCALIATTTGEEACAQNPWRWIKQRSRWQKGYAITWATHMRRPVALWRDLGWRQFFGVQLVLLGGLTSFLAMPAFWLLLAAGLGLDLPGFDRMARGWTMALVTVLWAGEAAMVAAAALALRDSGRPAMWRWIPVLWLYWPMGAVAAWWGLAEAFHAPFRWRKTEHGASKRDQPE